MLALGDTLSMVVLSERGFSREDYAKNHILRLENWESQRAEAAARFLAEQFEGKRFNQPNE